MAHSDYYDCPFCGEYIYSCKCRPLDKTSRKKLDKSHLKGATLVSMSVEQKAQIQALKTIVALINEMADDVEHNGACTIDDMTYTEDEFPRGFWRKLAKEVNYLSTF